MPIFLRALLFALCCGVSTSFATLAPYESPQIKLMETGKFPNRGNQLCGKMEDARFWILSHQDFLENELQIFIWPILRENEKKSIVVTLVNLTESLRGNLTQAQFNFPELGKGSTFITRISSDPARKTTWAIQVTEPDDGDRTVTCLLIH